MAAGEPLNTLCSGGTASALLSDGQLLLDATTVSTDDIDTGYTDIGVDGLVGLYGEVGYSETTGIDDAHVGLTTERRGDANHVLTDSEYEVTLAEVVARRVFIITEGERRVVAVEEDRAGVLTGTDTTGHEVRAERYGCGTASRRHVEAAASGIHQVAVDLLTAMAMPGSETKLMVCLASCAGAGDAVFLAVHSPLRSNS